MSTLEIKRHFKADPATVFAYVTQGEHLMKWWGPEGVHITENALDLSAPGPWFSVMENGEGARYKVSGEVTKVDPDKAVEFSWGWHDDDDVRGHESTVRFEVSAAADGGTDFVMIHSGLEDDTSAENHNGGWSSSFNKLAKLAG